MAGGRRIGARASGVRNVCEPTDDRDVRNAELAALALEQFFLAALRSVLSMLRISGEFRSRLLGHEFAEDFE